MTRTERENAHLYKTIHQRFSRKAEQVLPPRSSIPRFNRRSFALGMTAAGLHFTSEIGATPAAISGADIDSNPFTLGVASGEPEPDGIVIWTRIAPKPFEPGGGIHGTSVEVRWEIAADDGMREIVQSSVFITEAMWAHSVHVEVSGLQPNREYWYRFRVGEWQSPIGRTITAPAPGAMPEAFRFAFASCQRWDQGFYTAYRDMTAQRPDLIVHLGDYIYESAISNRPGLRDSPVRDLSDVPIISTTELRNLEQYRHRHAIYRRDPDLQDAHAIAPWLVTWDDHEVNNNYFGAIVRDSPAAGPLLERRAAAYQAYWEHMPLRDRMRPQGPDLPLYRSATFGNLIRFNVLDTRQYRSPQVTTCSDSERGEWDGYCAQALNPDRTMLGIEQKQWLYDGFGDTTTRWSVLAQQVPFSRIDYDDSPQRAAYGDNEMDKWDGYAAERDEILAVMADAARQQSFHPIVITGDVHSNYVWDIKENWDAPGSETSIGTEFVGTSIASNGDGPLHNDGAFTTQRGNWRGNPHNHLYDNHRGYVLIDVTTDELVARYQTVSSVESPDGDVNTLASFGVEHDRPGAQAEASY